MKYAIGFQEEFLSEEYYNDILKKAANSRADILTMTTLANSGHVGGSLSSIDIYTVLYATANVDPKNPFLENRDRIVVSHGHTSPAVYSTLAQFGFVDRDDVICGFRQAWSPFEGHIEREVFGVEWSTGNLGQGLSAACGMALASFIHKKDWRVFVCMGDGEQQKGQISEARRFAVKYNLSNIVAIIDYNQLQISGDISKVMPQNIALGWESDGWEVVTINGHDIQEIYRALKYATNKGKPVCIIANTIMGKGFKEIENKAKYHGSPLNKVQFESAMKELGSNNTLEEFFSKRADVKQRTKSFHLPILPININTGKPKVYGVDVKTDNRSAWGAVIEEIGRLNNSSDSKTTSNLNDLVNPVALIDCDLAESVKTGPFAESCPNHFFQTGIEEHHAATLSGALSTQGVVTFWADFGVFGIDETYNQQRLNDINHTNLKTICTHSGLDVGEDGKTHQAIDYIGLARNIYGFKVLLPADPNETDKAVRYMANKSGNWLMCVGRSKVPVITDEAGNPFFGENYNFEYGKSVWIRSGHNNISHLSIISTGTMTHKALIAYDILKSKGVFANIIHVVAPLALEEDMISKAANSQYIITYEDHHVGTGLGSLVAEKLCDLRLCPHLLKMGVAKYQPSGAVEDVFRNAGLSPEQLVENAINLIKR